MVYKVVNGAIPSGDEWMENSIASLKASGRNLVRELQDRSVDLSGDGGEFAEAYTDNNGRLNSVDTGSSTTAGYNLEGGEYKATVQTTGSEETSSSNVSNTTTDTYNVVINILGKCVMTKLRYKFGTNSTLNYSIKKNGSIIFTQSSPHSIAGTYEDTFSASDFDTFFESGDTCTIAFSSSNSDLWVSAVADAYTGTLFSYTDYNNVCNSSGDNYGFTAIEADGDDVIVKHTIPSGSFTSTISNSFLTALVEDWEIGANIQYKLTNATEDSGWLDYNEIQSFTAFTSEPTILQVKLVPKASSPSAGFPSIKGCALYE